MNKATVIPFLTDPRLVAKNLTKYIRHQLNDLGNDVLFAMTIPGVGGVLCDSKKIHMTLIADCMTCGRPSLIHYSALGTRPISEVTSFRAQPSPACDPTCRSGRPP